VQEQLSIENLPLPMENKFTDKEVGRVNVQLVKMSAVASEMEENPGVVEEERVSVRVMKDKEMLLSKPPPLTVSVHLLLSLLIVRECSFVYFVLDVMDDFKIISFVTLPSKWLALPFTVRHGFVSFPHFPVSSPLDETYTMFDL
jgi:hypothetical protein